MSNENEYNTDHRIVDDTPYPNSSFSRHRTFHHTYDDSPRMKVTIIDSSQEAPLERKLLEALGKTPIARDEQ
ncbi:hypothetical protein Y032_0573g171 [Ancylostoma ceylanicum]|uniref:Uncharacterized protein n=1 Tax=Ancylostoma ceylanicum TaxID=53326 RepID=A0A016WNW0_9BILA|nr:hypothetical protein Y032_0573g171 [Ancylostoma ceylanicum]